MDERDYKAMNKHGNGNEVLAVVSCWVSIAETKKYPKENETVWMYNAKDKCVWLGCYVYLANEGWFWAISNGTIYEQEGKIITEADIDDDYEITHWCTVPSLPCS